MDHSKNNQQGHLGVNKNSKPIRKSPLYQPTYHHHQQQHRHPPPPSQPQLNLPAPPPQPQVYNISKNDFRSIVQQLTGTPSRDPAAAGPAPHPPSRPPHPKSPSMRLQKIRPPPLTPVARPSPPPFRNPNPMPMPNPNPNPNLNPGGFFPRPSPIAVSPVSAYMKYLESSLLHSDGRLPVPSPGLLPPPPFPAFPSPRGNPYPYPNHQNLNQQHPGLLPSPGSQFVPPSPSSFLNLMSPKSPYSLLSPGFQYPPPLTPNFSFSPLSPGILGPGPGSHPPPPPSPGLLLPPSPSWFFPILSPRWRDM